MADWKLLGEVPDSEDEFDFDSQTTNNPDSAIETNKLTDPHFPQDIWDVPNSSQELIPPAKQPSPLPSALPISTASSPLSSVLSLDDLPNLSEIGQSQFEPQRSGRNSQLSQIVDLTGADEISTSYVQTNTESPRQYGGGEDISPSMPRPVSSKHTSIFPSQDLGYGLGAGAAAEGEDDVEQDEARMAAIRYERSLRPRKPIQEHPYLLENAHYSSLFKKHGVKPVQMAADIVRRRRENTYHDEEFHAPPTQESVLPAISEEGQRERGTDFDPYDLNYMSSSPPKTSPWVHRAEASSHPSSQIETDGTSVADGDLPTVAELLLRPHKEKRSRTTPGSEARKRRRRNVIDSDPADATDATGFTGEHVPPLEATTPLPQLDSAAFPSPRVSAGPESEVDDAVTRGVSNENRVQPPASESESDESAVVQDTAMNRMTKRIRGVLPASWLRLDQQSGRDKAQKDMNRRNRNRSPERENRRGVAQIKQSNGASTSTAWPIEESDDEPVVQPDTTDDIYHHQNRLEIQPLPIPSISRNHEDSSDDGSVVEQDVIDRMGSGSKRQLNISKSFSNGVSQRASKKNSHSNASLQRSRSTMSQPKISSFGNSRKSRPQQRSASKHGDSGSTTKRSHKNRPATARSARPAVPNLSILDVVEADAPRFVRIAARNAKRRKNQGRSSPSKKSIKLANRKDHIDAVSVLNTWRAGQIQQRPAVSESTTRRRDARRRPLSDTTANRQSKPSAASKPKPFAAIPRKLAKRATDGHSAKYAVSETATEPTVSEAQPNPNVETASATSYRPAVMEQDALDGNSRAFHFQKKFIDRIYRRPQRETTEERDTTPSAADNNANSSTLGEDDPPMLDEPAISVQPRRRMRKTKRPHRIDVDAPQYSHAADPVPVEQVQRVASDQVQLEAINLEKSKLRGLGSYGMQYSFHFEVFPLDSSVYFHESTLVGSGTIAESLSIANHSRLLQHRPAMFFQLGQQSLHWSLWSDQVSSELGILLDFIIEQLTVRSDAGGLPDLQTAVRASRFISAYVVQSMYFGDKAAIKVFVIRALEVVHGFNERFANYELPRYTATLEQISTVLQVYDSVLIAVLVTLAASQNDPALLNEQFQAEALLTKVASQQMRVLLQAGINMLRKDYEDLTQMRVRERGIRDDKPLLHSWVLVMKVLDSTKIMRCSFWEVLQSLISGQRIVTSTDVAPYEDAWETMFLLLPLTEFNASGIMISRSRFDAASDGWIIPQKLLKRVFQLYSDNPRQSPSFNNYCRAIIGRCHYLVDEWGWRRSAPVVGVIFDFFGSHELAHLRNEEVHRSPQFLEDLAGVPSLRIEPNDKCFHIFLKLLGLSIQRLRQIDATKDIRNLVARTMPNHNRQCLKEQNIHERDLAALRNHHDLLCTLFWATPKNLRPPVALLERLVVPSSSHKEACLINMRAWNQLARFIVAKGEATTSFRPFMQWQTSFFQQTLHQYDSVASDIQQQLHSLPKEVVTSISREMVDSMVSMNKEAVSAVLGATVTSSLDVMKHAEDLESALFCLNTMQLQQIFKHFSIAPPEFSWKILREALATLDTFVRLIDEFKDAEESQQTESQILNSAQADDALLVIEHDIARNYFGMTRCIMSEREGKIISDFSVERSNCVEAAITVAARLIRRFIGGGLVRLPQVFKTGIYCLFDRQPHHLSAAKRQYLVLFVSTLLQLNIDDFSELNFNIGELWLWSLVKPRRVLGYENLLAEQLSRRNEPLVSEAAVGLSCIPDYSINRDLLEYSLSVLRRSLRDAGPSLKKILSQEHGQTLKFAMEQMKNDLHDLVNEPSEHHAFVMFVREVISLIRAHGAEICTIDDFFYQMSREYSPSTQDPQLQVAAMISYGLRIRDGDSKVVHQLFFFLFNNLKQSIINNQIGAEVKLLQKGLKDEGIFSFVVGKMLPAIILATSEDASAFPILDIYVTSLWRYLGRRPMLKDLSGSLAQIATLLRSIQISMGAFLTISSGLSLEQLHVIRQMIRLMGRFWPVINVELASGENRQGWHDMQMVLDDFKVAFDGALVYLKRAAGNSPTNLGVGPLFSTVPTSTTTMVQTDQHIKSFADQITQDIKRNWVTSNGRINIQTAIKAKPGANIPGIALPTFVEEEVIRGLKEDVEEWLYQYDRAHGVRLPVETGAAAIIF